MKPQAILNSFLHSLNRALTPGRGPADPAEFKAVFDRFKSVLESNNRALETITDMGEKLGGEYLFDIVYVRNAYADLKKDMEQSVAAFDSLTRSRHRKLHESFNRIDALITSALDQAPGPHTGGPVVFLEDIAWGGEESAGGKAAQLAEVRNQLRMRVPEGFVITTAGFESFMRFNHLENRILDLKESSPESAFQELQELILHGGIPDEISKAIRKAVDRLRRQKGKSFLAVRSSAREEDSVHSFAGQFKTVLGVPLDPGAVERAYRKVVASLFDTKAAAYQRQTGYEAGTIKMAVLCMEMVDAASSGVIYSTTPDGEPGTMLITAAWGLGEGVVEGRTPADAYRVEKLKEPLTVHSTIGAKKTMIVADSKRGTAEVPVADDLRNKACLSPDQIKMLAQQALRIERYFGTPRDIEWAIDASGGIWIVQARPLKIQLREDAPSSSSQAPFVPGSGYPVLTEGKGIVVQQGAGAGKVFVARKPSDAASLPKGAVLVATHDSSLFVTSMPFVSAIITETGSETSHMAALCRELQIPTIVNLPHATGMLRHGQEVTVVASEEGNSRVYDGIIPDLLARAGHDRRQMESVYEFRRKRYILRYISPLHLIDPLMDEFTPERCRTMHDILRFMHEKSVAELVESARNGSAGLRRRGMVVPLELPVPAGLLVMDMGGGLSRGRARDRATFDEIESIPFKAIIRGMVHPGAWHAEAVALRAADFVSSMMRMPDITSDAGSGAGYNIAVVSREYVNMSIRFGYHFNMIDCYLSEIAKNNHVYFRFAGGATDLTKRSRRLDLIARILTGSGFAVKIKGDLLIARLAGLPREEMEQVLDRTGRLIAYARQLDAVLHNDRDIERFLSNFMNGNYAFGGAPQ